MTRVDYIRCQRNERRILAMILFVWAAACVISLAPVFGWKDAQFEWRITQAKECLISQDVGYQIFATFTTFYFPLILTLIFYWKIYQVSSSGCCRSGCSSLLQIQSRPTSISHQFGPPGQLIRLAEAAIKFIWRPASSATPLPLCARQHKGPNMLSVVDWRRLICWGHLSSVLVVRLRWRRRFHPSE